MKTKGYAAYSNDTPLRPLDFDRRELRDNDVAMEILYCGVCHSDLHMAHNDWGRTSYPIVLGHEIVGRVIQVGNAVKKYKVGDNVAVGCLVDSCQECDQCKNHEEQYCRNGYVGTYGGRDKITGEATQGGYSKHLVVREEFIVRVPDGMDLSKTPPILCAGITTYSPLKTWGVKKGSRVGVIGLGGLGHMAIKLAVAMGAHVTGITRSEDKKNDILSLGAHAALVSTNDDEMKKTLNSFDLIIDTVPVKHDINPYIPLLDIDGTLVIVGQLGMIAEPNTAPMILGRRRVAGSVIGGIKQTQEVIDFCAEHNIYPECEMIKMEQINEAFERLKKSDVRYRFVIDMATL